MNRQDRLGENIQTACAYMFSFFSKNFSVIQAHDIPLLYSVFTGVFVCLSQNEIVYHGNFLTSASFTLF